MQRSPSIHITKNNLALVLKQVLGLGSNDKTDYNLLAERILISGKRYSLSNRSLVVDKAKLVKSTSRVLLSTRDDAGSFSQLLLSIRRQRHHKGIALIKPGSREWLQIKEIAKLAMDFCNDFSLKRDEGFKAYINLALNKMQKYSLLKFNSIHQSICDDYDALQIIKQDITPLETQKVKQVYEKHLGEKGVFRDYRDSPDKFVCFVKAKEECHKLSVPIDHYVKAQFWGLEWCNGIPDPVQLIGPKAIDRLNRYLAEHNINIVKDKIDHNKKEKIADLKKRWGK